jgi:uncharacterized protein YbaP (TraB family)
MNRAVTVIGAWGTSWTVRSPHGDAPMTRWVGTLSAGDPELFGGIREMLGKLAQSAAQVVEFASIVREKFFHAALSYKKGDHCMGGRGFS